MGSQRSKARPVKPGKLPVLALQAMRRYVVSDLAQPGDTAYREIALRMAGKK